MPISKIPAGAIASGTIGTSQIADDAVTTAKILNDNVTTAKILNDNVTSAKIPNDAIGSTEIVASAVTRDELQSAAVNNISSDSIILNSTNGTADAGDFLVLDGTDGAGANANHRILFDETFVDKIGLFNINTLGSAGQAVKVNTGGTGLEFGSAGGLVKLAEVTDSSGSSAIEFDGLYAHGSTYQTLIIAHSHATGSGEIRCEVKGIGQGSYYNSYYYWYSVTGTNSNGVNGYGVANGSYGKLLGSWGESHGFRGNIIIHDPQNASNGSRICIEAHQVGWNNATSALVTHSVVGLGTTTGVDAFKYYHASGNFGAGNAVLYGVTK